MQTKRQVIRKRDVMSISYMRFNSVTNAVMNALIDLHQNEELHHMWLAKVSILEEFLHD
jgi:hypothetical protein